MACRKNFLIPALMTNRSGKQEWKHQGLKWNLCLFTYIKYESCTPAELLQNTRLEDLSLQIQLQSSYFRALFQNVFSKNLNRTVSIALKFLGQWMISGRSGFGNSFCLYNKSSLCLLNLLANEMMRTRLVQKLDSSFITLI